MFVLVGPLGFEPRTTGAQAPHSARLNYGPVPRPLGGFCWRVIVFSLGGGAAAGIRTRDLRMAQGPSLGVLGWIGGLRMSPAL